MDPRHAILFEPVKIGPVTAPNRFYQVPHCTGMGHLLPQTLAAMRGMKAEGGWGVVCTEYCSIHSSSDDHPYPFASLWDEGDVANNAAMVQAVKRHGALAGVELWHGGSRVSNLASRAPTLGPSSRRAHNDPIQSARMDLADIRALRTWQRDAAKRAVRAGFDIVYVYATHQYLLWQFLSHSHNDRSDDYGGNLNNRSRIVRELLEVTREAVGDKAAVAIRFSANGHGADHLTKDDARQLMSEWNPLVDLWDLVVDDYSGWEMSVSRFRQEGSLDDEIAGLRQSLGKPILTVGRFTSPDLMASRIKRGLVDFIGAARPSIADPFLPSKIREGRAEDIRECIGCNICYAHDGRGSAFRCTQNPTLGEEWRQDWHPEKVPAGKSESVLIVGAGPAGLEAALTLGRRGFDVTLADAGQQAGGRVNAESRLPGLAEWARVRDHRLHQIGKLNNVTLHLGSPMTASDVKDFGAEHVLIATGATWRRDALGRHQQRPLSGLKGEIFTPDDIFAGKLPQGAVVVYDDDGYYLGSVLALKLAASGAQVTLVTPDSTVCAWGAYTAEQGANHQALLKAGVKIKRNLALSGYDGKSVTLSSTYDEAPETLATDALLLVTLRNPKDALYRALADDPGLKPKTLRAIGDCYQPALIFHAVYSGHKAARELGESFPTPIRRDRLVL